MATLNKQEAAKERASKHAKHVWSCPVCGQKCRGNGGRASHQRKHVYAAGYDDDDIFGWGLRVLFNVLWRDAPLPEGLRPPYWRDPAKEEWSCDPVDRSGAAKYVIIMRAPGDPERQDKAPSLGGTTSGTEKIEALRQLRKASVESWRERILEHLADDVPRTFNRICVELVDKTADHMSRSNAEAALWQLVEDEKLVEHTMKAPILFRRRTA